VPTSYPEKKAAVGFIKLEPVQFMRNQLASDKGSHQAAFVTFAVTTNNYPH